MPVTLGPGWLFVLGCTLGGWAGVQLGRGMVWLLLPGHRAGNPLGWLGRQYRELWRGIMRYVPAWLDAIERAEGRGP